MGTSIWKIKCWTARESRNNAFIESDTFTINAAADCANAAEYSTIANWQSDISHPYVPTSSAFAMVRAKGSISALFNGNANGNSCDVEANFGGSCSVVDTTGSTVTWLRLVHDTSNNYEFKLEIDETTVRSS